MRGESIGRMVTHAPIEKRGDSTAWKVQKPTVYLGAVEYADLAYGGAGRPFGRPPPPFVMQANPSHWGLGMARHHAVIPYMTVPKLMVPSARAIADNLDASPATFALLSRQYRVWRRAGAFIAAQFEGCAD